MNVVLLNDSFPPLIDGVANTVVNYADVLTKNGDKAVVVVYPLGKRRRQTAQNCYAGDIAPSYRDIDSLAGYLRAAADGYPAVGFGKRRRRIVL